MVTDLGITLEYDDKKSSAENLYRQMFGRWPDYAISDTRNKILKAFLEDYGQERALYFFGFLSPSENESLCQRITKELETDEEGFYRELWDNICDFRYAYRDAVLALFDAYPTEQTVDADISQEKVDILTETFASNSKLAMKIAKILVPTMYI